MSLADAESDEAIPVRVHDDIVIIPTAHYGSSSHALIRNEKVQEFRTLLDAVPNLPAHISEFYHAHFEVVVEAERPPLAGRRATDQVIRDAVTPTPPPQ